MVGRKKKTLDTDLTVDPQVCTNQEQDGKDGKKKPKSLATMERFIKRREKGDGGEMNLADTIQHKKCDPHDHKDQLKEDDVSGEQIFQNQNQKQRKKKAKFAFNTCDITHDNLPVLSDDENIIMQLNIHPDVERTTYENENDSKKTKGGSVREYMFQEDTCFAQDATHVMAQRRVHVETNNGDQHGYSDTMISHSHSHERDIGHQHDNDKEQRQGVEDQHTIRPQPSPYDIFENDFFDKHPAHLPYGSDGRCDCDEGKLNTQHDQMMESGNPQDLEDSQDFKVVKLLRDFEEKNKHNEWPISTNISCYWCCHKFFNAPFGIPVKYNDEKFHVFGCFCGLECALAYNLSMKDQIDEMWERCNLLNFLCRKTNYNKQGFIKPAPPRLSLKMFGGYLSIEEFRNFSNKNKMLNINFPPMQTITQQIEEINECDVNSDFKYIPIDTDRINKYKEKMRLKRTKPLNDTRNTLDSAVNIKITSINS